MNQDLTQMTSSPLFKRAQEMGQGKSDAEIEKIARNICEQKGIRYDDAVQMFNQMFGQRNH